MANMTGSNIVVNYVDKRRSGLNGGSPDSFINTGKVIFTANASGTTTTLVGANSAPGTDDTNTVRRGEEFILCNSAGVPKDNVVRTITGIAVSTSTTVTFSPAAAAATATGDIAKIASLDDFKDEDDLDTRLLANGYTQTQINTMNQNDKIWAIRQKLDPTGI